MKRARNHAPASALRLFSFLTCTALASTVAAAFQPRALHPHHPRSSALFFSSMEPLLRGITIPILDASPESLAADDLAKRLVVPLPSRHFCSNELATLNVYGFQVDAPVHRMLIEEATKSAGTYQVDRGDIPKVAPGVYGHVVSRSDDDLDSLVGAVGCAVDIMMAAPAAGGPPLGPRGPMGPPGQMGPVNPFMEPLGPMGSKDEDEGKLDVEFDIGSSIDDAVSKAQGEERRPKPFAEKGTDGPSPDDGPLTVVVRGSFRFVVREVIKTLPFPVAVVDELRDDVPTKASSSADEKKSDDAPEAKAEEEVEEEEKEVEDEVSSGPIIYNDFDDGFTSTGESSAVDTDDKAEDEEDEDEDDDDDDDDNDDHMYADLSSSELVRRCMHAMNAMVNQKLQAAQEMRGMSPLEQSILEDAGMPVPRDDIARGQAEEQAAVFDVFQTELVDICPRPIDVHYAVGLMCAEMADVDNDFRVQCLKMTNGLERMRMILSKAEAKVGMAAAKRITAQITEEVSGDERDLKIGTPEIPKWAYQIKRGQKVSYFWNEVEGWCKGVVAEDPVLILDELIIPVTFDDDGSTHKLPFKADEKVRWRPGDMD